MIQKSFVRLEEQVDALFALEKSKTICSHSLLDNISLSPSIFQNKEKPVSHISSIQPTGFSLLKPSLFCSEESIRLRS